MNINRPILLVEDDVVDQKTTERAFKRLKVTNPLEITQNGLEAIEFLEDPDKALPCLILLDLNMPRMNGIEFLEIVKNDKDLRRVPVVVLTTSNSEKDVVASYNFSVAGYLIKPVAHQGFIDVIRTIDIYWTLCTVPPELESVVH